MQNDLRTFQMTSTTNTVQNMAQLATSSRTTTLHSYDWNKMTTKQVNPVLVHPDYSCKELLRHCTHVHQPAVQVCKPGESLALKKSQAPTQWKDFCEQTPIDKARHSGYFEGIGHFPGDPCKFHLKPAHKPA